MSEDQLQKGNDGVLSEPELQRVLERAIQLDKARGAEFKIAELRRIAEELNISSTSLEQALIEVQRAETRPAPGDALISRARKWWPAIRAGLITVGIGVGAFLGGVLAGGKQEFLNFWLFIATANIAIYYRHWRTNAAYYRDMTALWAWFGAGWFLSSGMKVEGDTTWHLIVPGIAAMIIGTVLLNVDLSWKKSKAEQPPEEMKAST